MVGDAQTGYIVVPDSATLQFELENRCTQTGRNPAEWVSTVKRRSTAVWVAEDASKQHG